MIQHSLCREKSHSPTAPDTPSPSCNYGALADPDDFGRCYRLLKALSKVGVANGEGAEHFPRVSLLRMYGPPRDRKGIALPAPGANEIGTSTERADEG